LVFTATFRGGGLLTAKRLMTASKAGLRFGASIDISFGGKRRSRGTILQRPEKS
jgi:hypothetical protein